MQVNPNSPTALTSPIHDNASGNVFVEDVGGFLYLINSTTAAVTKSGRLDFGVGLGQGPIVDSTAGLVYVFASSDGTGSCTGGADCSAVYELAISFPAGGTGSEVVVGDSTVSGYCLKGDLVVPEKAGLAAFPWRNVFSSTLLHERRSYGRSS